MERVRKCLILFSIVFSIASSEIIKIDDGFLDGTVLFSRKGVEFDAFMKIPYAEAPTYQLRFQPPVKKTPWEGAWNATSYGPMCMQSGSQAWPVDEDCLHLNVFTKNLMKTPLKPVLVFIHGGAFESGSSNNHRPDYFMDRDLVLVTMNYRLNAFGFLASGTNKAMGNMGLKDLAMGLKWVKDNIEIFGGDPQRVTISGLSAGGFAVTSLLASDMSRDLFQRAIVMSGSITWMSRMKRDYKEISNYIASQVNCTNTTQDFVECLQGVPATQIVQVNIIPATSCGSRVAMVWNPVIEGDFEQEKFFSKNPLDVFKDSPSLFNRTQVMIGITEHEIIYAAPVILSDQQFVTKMKNEFNQLMYECFYTAEVPKDSSHFKHMYIPLDEIDMRSFEGLGKLCSDGVIGYGSHRLVHLLSNFTDVYYYKFSYSGQQSVFNFPRNSPYGITHADDIQYLFNTWYVGFMIDVDHPDNLMVERLTRMWEQFVWRGNPNNSTDDYLKDMQWPKHDWINEHYLDIGTHLVEKQGLFLERFKAWERLSSGSKALKSLNFILISSLLLKLFL